MDFPSMSVERRITFQLKNRDTTNLQSLLMRLQDKEPNSPLIPVVKKILSDRDDVWREGS